MNAQTNDIKGIIFVIKKQYFVQGVKMMRRYELLVLVIAALILMFIAPYFIIVKPIGDSTVTGIFGITWEVNQRVLPIYISRASLTPPLTLALIMLLPGFYYIYSTTRNGENKQYLQQVLILFVILWSAILFIVPSSIWIYEGIPLEPIANYWMTLPNFITLSFILFIFIPSITSHQRSLEKDNTKRKPLYKTPGFILTLIMLFVPDFISVHSHSTRVWNSQTYVEFGTIAYTVGFQIIKRFNQVNTSIFFTIAPAPAFPAFVLRWLFYAIFIHQVLAFLDDETTHRNAIIITIGSLLSMLFLSIMYSVDFLVGEFMRYPIPIPLLQLVGFSFIQTHQESKERIQKDPELKIVKVPLTYIIYSKIMQQIGKESEVD